MKYLQQIDQFSHSDEPLMLVLGRADSAKSKLLEAARETVKLLKPAICLDGKDHIKSTDVITALSWQWQIDISLSKGLLIDQLHIILAALRQQDHTGLLIVDDAHLLPFSILSALIQIAIEQTEKCYLHLILAGRDSLKDKVATLYEQEIPVIRVGMLSHAMVQQTVMDFLEEKKIQAPATTINHLVDRLFQDAHGQPERLQILLRALTVKDFLYVRSDQEVAPPALKKPSKRDLIMGEHGARAFALVGLVATVFGLYWYEHHPRSVSPPMPSKPYHYQMVKNVPLTHPSEKIKKAEKFYTIQLMGSFDESKAKSYIASHNLTKQAQVYTQQFHNKPWYVVGIGHYADRTQAKTVLHQLNAKQAWVRPIQPMSLWP